MTIVQARVTPGAAAVPSKKRKLNPHITAVKQFASFLRKMKASPDENRIEELLPQIMVSSSPGENDTLELFIENCPDVDSLTQWFTAEYQNVDRTQLLFALWQFVDFLLSEHSPETASPSTNRYLIRLCSKLCSLPILHSLLGNLQSNIGERRNLPFSVLKHAILVGQTSVSQDLIEFLPGYVAVFCRMFTSSKQDVNFVSNGVEFVIAWISCVPDRMLAKFVSEFAKLLQTVLTGGLELAVGPELQSEILRLFASKIAIAPGLSKSVKLNVFSFSAATSILKILTKEQNAEVAESARDLFETLFCEPIKVLVFNDPNFGLNGSEEHSCRNPMALTAVKTLSTPKTASLAGRVLLAAPDVMPYFQRYSYEIFMNPNARKNWARLLKTWIELLEGKDWILGQLIEKAASFLGENELKLYLNSAVNLTDISAVINKCLSHDEPVFIAGILELVAAQCNSCDRLSKLKQQPGSASLKRLKHVLIRNLPTVDVLAETLDRILLEKEKGSVSKVLFSAVFRYLKGYIAIDTTELFLADVLEFVSTKMLFFAKPLDFENAFLETAEFLLDFDLDNCHCLFKEETRDFLGESDGNFLEKFGILLSVKVPMFEPLEASIVVLFKLLGAWKTLAILKTLLFENDFDGISEILVNCETDVANSKQELFFALQVTIPPGIDMGRLSLEESTTRKMLEAREIMKSVKDPEKDFSASASTQDLAGRYVNLGCLLLSERNGILDTKCRKSAIGIALKILHTLDARQKTNWFSSNLLAPKSRYFTLALLEKSVSGLAWDSILKSVTSQAFDAESAILLASLCDLAPLCLTTEICEKYVLKPHFPVFFESLKSIKKKAVAAGNAIGWMPQDHFRNIVGKNSDIRIFAQIIENSRLLAMLDGEFWFPVVENCLKLGKIGQSSLGLFRTLIQTLTKSDSIELVKQLDAIFAEMCTTVTLNFLELTDILIAESPGWEPPASFWRCWNLVDWNELKPRNVQVVLRLLDRNKESGVFNVRSVCLQLLKSLTKLDYSNPTAFSEDLERIVDVMTSWPAEDRVLWLKKWFKIWKLAKLRSFASSLARLIVATASDSSKLAVSCSKLEVVHDLSEMIFGEHFSQPEYLEILRLIAEFQPEIFTRFENGKDLNLLFSRSEIPEILAQEESKAVFMELVLVLIQKNAVYALTSSLLPLFLSSYNATLSRADRAIFSLLRSSENCGIDFSRIFPLLFGKKCGSHYANLKKTGLALWNRPSIREVFDCFEPQVLWASVVNFPIKVPLNQDPAGAENCLFRNEEHPAPTMVRTQITEIYDPRFVLPLLAHATAPSNILPIDKFIDHGCFAYVLAALTSDSESTRAIAYFVLSQVKEHIKSLAKTADRTLIWQCIRMIRNSVLVKNFQWPKLPVIFCARCISILNKPESERKSYEFLLMKYVTLEDRLNLKIVPCFEEAFWHDSLHFREYRIWFLTLLAESLDDWKSWLMAKNVNLVPNLFCYFATCIPNREERLLFLRILETACKTEKVEMDVKKNFGLPVFLKLNAPKFEDCENFEKNLRVMQISGVL